MTLLACVALLLPTGQALAAGPFTPIVPPTCPSTTNIPWNYAVDGTTYSFELPSDKNCVNNGEPCPHYINNLDHHRFFVANHWVTYVGFRLKTFKTEANFDFISWGLEGTALSSKSGTGVANTILSVTTMASFGSKRALLNFKTDSNVTYPGFTFDQLGVCTSRTSLDTAAPATLSLKRRYQGVLLGTDDTVYLSFPASARYHYPIALWRDAGSAGTDFDLYARCGAKPTKTQYDAASTSADDQEFIDVGNCTGTAYVAVYAYSASAPGAFNLARGIHTHHVPLRVGTASLLSATQMTGLGINMTTAARYYYGHTEGERMVTQIDLYNSASCSAGSCGGSNCDICYHDEFGRAHAGPQVHIFRDSSDPRIIAHELGHYDFANGDEYIDYAGPPPTQLEQCGHTVMADALFDNFNICTPLDHLTDASPGAGWSGLSSGWQQAASAAKAIEFENVTYDNYPYNSFDFDNQVGFVITH
jgi:hypothetical protein